MNLHQLLAQRAAAAKPLRILLIGAGKGTKYLPVYHEATPETVWGHYDKPYHLIGLELGISVAVAGLRGEATGVASGFRGDVVSVAKRDLNEGESLDGEGGYTVYGRLMPAADSLRCAGLPIGLAHGVKIVRRVAKGQTVTWHDVAVPDSEAVRVRREMEAVFRT